jgi:cystathionine gamma-synthase
MSGFGGIVSVETGSRVEAVKFASRTELFSLAESLGGVESLLGYPAMMSHAFAAGGEFAVPENLVRLSVGIEDPEDLQEDLRRALAGMNERTA